MSYRTGWLGRAKLLAVDRVSLRACAGEVIGIVGPNGSGKSSLLRCLLGVESPDQGEALVLGEKPGAKNSRRRIGFCSEQTLPFQKLTAAEFLTLKGTISGLSVAEATARANETLKLVDLENAASRPHGEFSSGMARRLAFAQANYLKPELLILDEPTTAIDPLGVELVRDELRRYRDAGGCALVATHSLEDFDGLFTKILVLLDGKCVAFGPPAEVLGESASLGNLLRQTLRKMKHEAPQGLDAQE